MADQRVCSIDGCDKPVKGRGWCSAHVAKWRKYGDPLRSVRTPPSSTQCKADGCNGIGTSTRKGFCGRHYKRLWRYGDPDGGASIRADRGEALQWLKSHVSFDGDACLKWPFADRGNGYGAVSDEEGNLVGAHRLMCSLAHGRPESADLLATHSCGKGHEGCINPRHLRWGTVADNSADMIAHGTAARGTANAICKLTEADVREIRHTYPLESQNQLASRFHVDQSTIWKIIHRKAWAWLDLE